jgi:hypothetical protein
MPLKVMYGIRDLGIDGAEKHVTTLMSQLDREGFRPDGDLSRTTR